MTNAVKPVEFPVGKEDSGYAGPSLGTIATVMTAKTKKYDILNM